MGKAKSKPISPDNPQERIEEHPAFLLGIHPTEDSFLVAAPPGSGKPVGVVIPNLLRYADSVVVHDPIKDFKL
ncbi:type IV secretory system conjugative DNA transfer family protein [Pseudomonas savastanoi]|uniref:Conjugal transfer protein n=2 Tax=Pseudomonas savastanoi pv. glycinea TaxID=318 RepID=A0A0P9SK59_PSESG|nr:type IV secretory system conjugative DNA transfer family protein [Pseudomonas savastanoi]RMO19597.1 hypothetical protein ALQ46_200041 [Pseudomonas savastanoi pv. phaseolicola]EFW77254.1 hypothetical protein PsgB076_29510 [Pseudomonas savastanoi pv. glycinea str. B076]KPC26843.1 Uncharacterized protein AC498_0497 [Pseudomonas savastanoi pv. glycinea]KPX43307.1 hypothetical protein ALO37_200123 [Pseudomonas savastanoi pv. glycinea]MCQ3007334.1 type IV secretory system conjugative DNA transfer